MRPMLPHLFDRSSARDCAAKATDELAGILRISSHSQPKGQFTLLPWGELKGKLDGPAGIQGSAHLPG